MWVLILEKIESETPTQSVSHARQFFQKSENVKILTKSDKMIFSNNKTKQLKK